MLGAIDLTDARITGNPVIGGAAQGVPSSSGVAGVVGQATGGGIYSRFQDEDSGLNDLYLRGARDTPSTSRVSLHANVEISSSNGGADCFVDAGERQLSGGDETRLPYFHFDGSYTVGTDASGINACTAQDRPGVYFVFAYRDNPGGDFAARGWLSSSSAFQQNVRAAAALWARESPASAKLGLAVLVDANSSAPRFSADAFYSENYGSFLGPKAATACSRPAHGRKS